MQPPSDEQYRLLQLLLNNQLEMVTLGIELLAQREDRAFFARALGLVALARLYPEAAQVAKQYLASNLPQEWASIQHELQWMQLGILRQQTAATIFQQIIRPYQAKIAIYESYMELAPEYAYVYLPLAIIAYNQQRKPQAQTYLKRMMELDPNQPLYPFHYGSRALPQTKETLEERLYYLHQAATAPNTTVQYRFVLATTYAEEVNDAAQAIHWFQQTLALRPNDHTVLQWLVRIHTQQKEFAQAERIYEQLRLYYPQNDRVLTDYACFALYHQNKPDKALQLAQAATATPHPEPRAYTILALVQWYGFQHQRGMEDALKILRRLNHETLLTRRLHRDLRDRCTQLPPFSWCSDDKRLY